MRAVGSLLFVVVASGLVPGAPTASAQTCETRPLAFDAFQGSEIEPVDCRFPAETCSDCIPYHGEYWTLEASAGELILVTVEGTTGQFVPNGPAPVVLDPAGRIAGADWAGVCDPAAPDSSRRCPGQWLTAATSGTYRVLVRTSGYIVERFGGYAIRARRPSTTVAGWSWAMNSGSSVFLSSYAHVSPLPVLEYAVLAGSAPGAIDVGFVSLGAHAGAVFRADFHAVPSGTYFVRIVARTAAGWGPPGNELELTATDGPERLTLMVSGRTVHLWWSPPAGTSPFYDALKPGFPAVAKPSSSFELLVSRSPRSTAPEIYDVGKVYGFSTDAPPGTYYVRVRGRTPLGVTAPSNEVVVQVP